MLHQRHAHRREVLPGHDRGQELHPRHQRRGLRGDHRRAAREPTSASNAAWTRCARMPFRSASLPVLPAKTQASYAPRSTSTTRNREPEQPCVRQPCRTWLSTTAGNTSSKRSLLPNPREHNAGPGANQKQRHPTSMQNSGASPSLRHVYLPTLGHGQGADRKRGRTHPAACM